MKAVLLKIEEAAREIGFSRSKTYELVHTGELPAIRVGGQLRIPAAALDSWVARQVEKVAKA